MNISGFKLFLAKSAYAPKEIFEVLAKDEEYFVRVSAAKNLICARVSEIIALNENQDVRIF